MARLFWLRALPHTYLTESVCNVVFQEPILAQIRRLILFYKCYEKWADGVVRELIFAERLDEYFL